MTDHHGVETTIEPAVHLKHTLGLTNDEQFLKIENLSHKT